MTTRAQRKTQPVIPGLLPPFRQQIRSLLILLLLAGARELQAEEYVIMTEELKPFQYLHDGEIRGACVEIVREILKTVNHPDTIVILPWARAYKEIRSTPRTILFSMVRSPERERLFKWVGPILDNTVYLYKKRGSDIHVKTLDDAKNVISISTPRDFFDHQFLKSKGFTNLDITINPIHDFRKLALGRADLIPTGEFSVRYLAEEAGIDPDILERTPVKLYDAQLYVAFHRGTPDTLIMKWQAALEKLKCSGKYRTIVQRYR